MPLAPDRPHRLARDMVDAIAAYYDGNDIALPHPRFVTTGTVVADCELLAVSVERIYPHAGDAMVDSATAVRAHPGHSMRGLVAAVTVLRCVPSLDGSGQPPPAEDIEAGAALVLEDAQHVWNALHAAHKAGVLTSCNSLGWSGWDSYGPEGGMAGGTLVVRAGLE